MNKSSEIKKKKRESLITKELSSVLQNTFRDHAILKSFFVSRIELSRDGGLCNIFLSSIDATQEGVNDAMKQVVLFAPSTRTSLAKVLQGRYVPEVRFLYDAHLDKVRDLNSLLYKVGSELKDLPEEDDSIQESDL